MEERSYSGAARDGRNGWVEETWFVRRDGSLVCIGTLNSMNSEHTLQGAFQARGEFWTPEKPDRQVRGRLAYEAGRIELELFGSFGQPPGDDLPETEIILGYTEAGPCTLWRGIRTRSSSKILSQAELAHSIWVATHLFLGAHFERSDEIVFSSVSFGFDVLESWLRESPFEQSIETDSDGHTATTVRHEFPTSLTVPLPGQDAILELEFVFRRGGDLFRSITWEHEAGLKTVPVEPQHYNWFAEHLTDLQSLLGLLVGEAVTPTRVSGRLSDDERANVQVFFAYVGGRTERLPHSAEMLVSRDNLGERLAPTVATWFEQRDVLRTTVALLFGTLYTRDLPGEFRFLALTQALETFHRRTRDGLFVKVEEYAAVEESLLAAIPEGIPHDLRQALTARISYGNEVSQRRRLQDLMTSLDDASRQLVSSDPTFIERVVEERNYLTHYPEGQTPPMNSAELFYTSARLRTLLTLLLLKEINISGTEAVEGVLRTRWYRIFAH